VKPERHVHGPDHVRREPLDEAADARLTHGALPHASTNVERHLKAILCGKRHHCVVCNILWLMNLVVKQGSPKGREWQDGVGQDDLAYRAMIHHLCPWIGHVTLFVGTNALFG
jgi:hypothetical protein